MRAITIVSTCVDLILNPSGRPVYDLNSTAFIINFSPSKKVLSLGPIINLTIAFIMNITPTETIMNTTG